MCRNFRKAPAVTTHKARWLFKWKNTTSGLARALAACALWSVEEFMALTARLHMCNSSGVCLLHLCVCVCVCVSVCCVCVCTRLMCMRPYTRPKSRFTALRARTVNAGMTHTRRDEHTTKRTHGKTHTRHDAHMAHQHTTVDFSTVEAPYRVAPCVLLSKRPWMSPAWNDRLRKGNSIHM